MGIKQGLKQIFLRFDLLAVPASLRVRGQPVYESLVGGVLSFVIMLLFIVIFWASFNDVVNKVDISYTQSVADQTQSTNEINQLQFAIGIDGISLGNYTRYFDIFLQDILIVGFNGNPANTTKKYIKLEACNLNDWRVLGTEFQTQYNVFSMNLMLCPTSNSKITLQGYKGSNQWKYLTLHIKKCTNNSIDSMPCHPDSTINTYINSYLTANDFFKVKFLILDSRIVASSTYPISKLLQKKIFLSFTNTLGSTGFISFQRYQITTDNSIMPYSSQTVQIGNFIQKYATNTVGINSDKYVYLQFLKATQQLQVKRQVTKLDQMLSYIGGLFSLLWIFISFIFGSFNQYRYELYAAQGAFSFDQTGRKIKQQDLGICNYFLYSVYDWLNLFCWAPKSWDKMKQVDQTRKQINSQLDVKYLFKKIRNLQKVASCLLDQNKRICLMLTKQPTLQETKRQRKILQLYESLISDQNKIQQQKQQPQYVIQNLDQKSGQNFVITGQKYKQINLSSFQINRYNFEQTKQQSQIIQLIKQSYKNIQNENSQISKGINNKIPQLIKSIIKNCHIKNNTPKKNNLMIENLSKNNEEYSIQEFEKIHNRN